MSSRLDELIVRLLNHVGQVLGSRHYRKLPLSLSVGHDLGNRLLADVNLVKRVVRDELDSAAIDGLVRHAVAGYRGKERMQAWRWFAYAAYDILRFGYYRLVSRPTKQTDFCFFITNAKFMGFTSLLRESLEKSGYTISYWFWSPLDQRQSGLASQQCIAATIPFPRFWSNEYREFRNFCLVEDRIAGGARAIRSKKVVVIEGCLLTHHMLGRYLRGSEKQVVCLQWGYFGKSATKMGWRNMPFDKFLVWGEFFRAAFAMYNEELSITSVGHPTLSGQTESGSEKVILFAVQRTLEEHITSKEVESFVHLAVAFARSKPDYEVRIRSHPDFPVPDEWKAGAPTNVVWHDYYLHTLNSSLKGSRYCVSISSTLGIEAVASGTYPIYIKMNDVPFQLYESFNMLSPFQHVFSPEGLVEGVESLDGMAWMPFLLSFRGRLFKDFQAHAVENMRVELNR